MAAVIYVCPGDEALISKALKAYTHLKTCTYYERGRLLEYDMVIADQRVEDDAT